MSPSVEALTVRLNPSVRPALQSAVPALQELV